MESELDPGCFEPGVVGSINTYFHSGQRVSGLLVSCSDRLFESLRAHSSVGAACRLEVQVVRSFRSRKVLLRLPSAHPVSTRQCCDGRVECGPSTNSSPPDWVLPTRRPTLLLCLLPPFLCPHAACTHATYLNPVPKAKLSVTSSRKSPLTDLPICPPPLILYCSEAAVVLLCGGYPSLPTRLEVH